MEYSLFAVNARGVTVNTEIYFDRRNLQGFLIINRGVAIFIFCWHWRRARYWLIFVRYILLFDSPSLLLGLCWRGGTVSEN